MIEKYSRKLFSSRISIVGVFTILIILLTLPLLIVFSSQPQNTRQNAEGPTPNLLPPQGGFGSISGYVYLDKNENGKRELEETGIPNIQIQITQINKDIKTQHTTVNITTIATTDSSGYFRYGFVNPGADSLTSSARLILPPGYKTIDTNPILINNLSQTNNQILEFGLFPIIQPPTPTLFQQKNKTH